MVAVRAVEKTSARSDSSRKVPWRSGETRERSRCDFECRGGREYGGGEKVGGWGVGEGERGGGCGVVVVVEGREKDFILGG